MMPCLSLFFADAFFADVIDYAQMPCRAAICLDVIITRLRATSRAAAAKMRHADTARATHAHGSFATR